MRWSVGRRGARRPLWRQRCIRSADEMSWQQQLQQQPTSLHGSCSASAVLLCRPFLAVGCYDYLPTARRPLPVYFRFSGRASVPAYLLSGRICLRAAAASHPAAWPPPHRLPLQATEMLGLRLVYYSDATWKLQQTQR